MSEEDTKTLRVGLLTAIHHLDPRKAWDVDSMMVLRQIVEPTYLPSGEGLKIQPVLFEALLRRDGEEGRHLRARVRRDLLFSDGKPLTAADVVASLAEASLVQENAEVRAEGEEVLFTLRRPNARFELTLSHSQCSVYRFDATSQKLIGTGPFMLEEGSTPEQVRLVRNPHYRGKVSLDRVHFLYYPTDATGKASALSGALQAGEVDLTQALPREEISELTGLRKSFQPTLSTAVLFANHQSPRLQNSKVRQAIGLSIDRMEVASQCYSNPLAFKAVSLLPRGFQTVDGGLVFDRNRAMALLKEVGEEGVPRGLSLFAIWGPRTYLPNPAFVAQILAGQLKELGIEVVADSTADAVEFRQKMIHGDYDLVLAGWAADTLDPCDFLEALVAGDRVPDATNVAVSSNLGRYQNDEMDRLLREYRAERRQETLYEISRRLQKDVPLVPLLYGGSAIVMSFRVLGFRPSPLTVFSLADLDLKG